MSQVTMQFYSETKDHLPVDGFGWICNNNVPEESSLVMAPSFDLALLTTENDSVVTTDNMFGPEQPLAGAAIQSELPGSESWLVNLPGESKHPYPEQCQVTECSFDEVLSRSQGSLHATNMHAESMCSEFQLDGQPYHIEENHTENLGRQYARCYQPNCQATCEFFVDRSCDIPYLKPQLGSVPWVVQDLKVSNLYTDSEQLYTFSSYRLPAWDNSPASAPASVNQVRNHADSQSLDSPLRATDVELSSPSLPHKSIGLNESQPHSYYSVPPRNHPDADVEHHNPNMIFSHKANHELETSEAEEASLGHEQSAAYLNLPCTLTDQSTFLQPRRGISTRDKSKDDLLLACKAAGMSYKDIKVKGNFEEAESTLRGRYRALTKPKEARVRKPEWTRHDIAMLQQSVAAYMRSRGGRPLHYANYELRHGSRAHLRALSKVPWKEVADYMANRGCYRFGNATVKKKFLEVVGIRVNDTSQLSPDGGEAEV